MKTAYATIKGIEVIRALRKGHASSFYDGQPQGEVNLANRVFGTLSTFVQGNHKTQISICNGAKSNDHSSG